MNVVNLNAPIELKFRGMAPVSGMTSCHGHMVMDFYSLAGEKPPHVFALDGVNALIYTTSEKPI
jgi:hypothetical protein